MNTFDLIKIATVIRAAKTVEEILRGVTDREFKARLTIKHAVVSQLVLIGSSVERLSEGFKAMAPDLNWNQFVRMKEGFLKNGLNFNDEEVWIYATENVPNIITLFTSLLQTAVDFAPLGSQR